MKKALIKVLADLTKKEIISEYKDLETYINDLKELSQAQGIPQKIKLKLQYTLRDLKKFLEKD